MNQISSKAILVVSFGTSYTEARIASIEKIEQEIASCISRISKFIMPGQAKMILSVLSQKRQDLSSLL